MSGFTRDSQRYGDQLVYEALHSQWSRHHRNCRCGSWLNHLANTELRIVREGSGFVAIVGPRLTEGVDDGALTTDSLWEAVTGRPGDGRAHPLRDMDELRKLDRRASDRALPRSPYTWRKFGDEWCVRGQNLTPEVIVDVTDRHGRSSRQRVFEILSTTRTGWQLARVVPEEPEPSS